MPNEIFDCLVEDIEPRDRKNWPDAVCQTLSRLKDRELQGYYGLEQLVHSKTTLRGAFPELTLS